MAFEVTIEADARLDRAKFVETMEAYGTVLEDLGKYVRVFFPISKASLTFQECAPHAVRAEDASGLDWEICSISTFRYARGSSEDSGAELNELLRFLAASTTAFFVVSVDFAVVTAVRDEAGLRIFPIQE
jgi:hypothetical protein